MTLKTTHTIYCPLIGGKVSIGYGFPILRQIIMRQAETLPELAAQERSILKATDYDHEIVDRVIEVINENCQQLKKQFKSSPN